MTRIIPALYTPANPEHYVLPSGETARTGREHIPALIATSPRAPALIAGLTRVAVGASRMLKFQLAAVNLRQPDGMYAIVAYADPGDLDFIGGASAAEWWDALLLPEFRISDSYLVPPEHAFALQERGGYIHPGAGPEGVAAPDDPLRWDPYHLLVTPLLDHNGERIGLFCVDKPRDGRIPSEEDVEDLETLARYAALEVENFVLSHGLQHIEAVGVALTHIGDPSEIAVAVAEGLRSFVPYDACTVYELVGDGLSPLAAHGAVEQGVSRTARGCAMRLGEGLAGWAALHGEELLVPDVARDPRSAIVPGAQREESVLVVPMRFDERVVGVIALTQEGLGRFHRADVRVAQVMASHAATALEGARARERERREAEARLLAEVRERTERENAGHLAELSRLRDDFTAMVAHELATPLATVRGFAELLGADDLGAEGRAVALAAIRAGAESLQRLVADAQTVATIEGGGFSVEPRPVELSALLEDAAAAARALPGDHPVSVASARATVLADPGRIGQVLRNLLGNAAKYSPPGAPIDLRSSLVGDRVRIEVADRGPGIDPGDRARIFEKFGRGRGQGGVPGSGLGLYISRLIAEAHGTEITVHSERGGGSVFAFYLEVVDGS